MKLYVGLLRKIYIPPSVMTRIESLNSIRVMLLLEAKFAENRAILQYPDVWYHIMSNIKRNIVRMVKVMNYKIK